MTADIFDLADEVAAEHLAWARRHRQNATMVAESIGYELAQGQGVDDVRDALATTWLLLRTDIAERRPRKAAKRRKRAA